MSTPHEYSDAVIGAISAAQFRQDFLRSRTQRWSRIQFQGFFQILDRKLCFAKYPHI